MRLVIENRVGQLGQSDGHGAADSGPETVFRRLIDGNIAGKVSHFACMSTHRGRYMPHRRDVWSKD